MSARAPHRPEKEYRSGTIIGAIWRHESQKEGRKVVKFSIRIYKSYCDPDTDDWHETDYYFPEELPRVRLVADKCYEYVALRERDPNAPIDAKPVEEVF